MDINLTLFAQAIAFALLIGFTVKFIWPPLLLALEKRQKEIADGLTAAQEGQRALEMATQQSQQVLLDAKQKASNIIAQAEAQGLLLKEQATSQAEIEKKRILANAHAETQQAIQQAREALSQRVASLALLGAERILQKELSLANHDELLNQVIAEL